MLKFSKHWFSTCSSSQNTDGEMTAETSYQSLSQAFTTLGYYHFSSQKWQNCRDSWHSCSLLIKMRPAFLLALIASLVEKILQSQQISSSVAGRVFTDSLLASFLLAYTNLQESSKRYCDLHHFIQVSAFSCCAHSDLFSFYWFLLFCWAVYKSCSLVNSSTPY